MFQNASETLTLIASAAVQWLFYWKRLPKDFAPKRILVVKLDHLGDVLLATPVFSNLRQSVPKCRTARIDRCVEPRCFGEAILMLIRSWEYDSPAFCRTGPPTSLRQTFQLYRELRRQKYDLMVELRNDWRIILFSLLRVTPKRLDRAAQQVANKLGFAQFTGIHETTPQP